MLSTCSKDDINIDRQDLQLPGGKRIHPAKIHVICAVLREFLDAICPWDELKQYEEHKPYFDNKAVISQAFHAAGGWHMFLARRCKRNYTHVNRSHVGSFQ